MKSKVVRMSLPTFAVFTIVAAASVFGDGTTIALPNGSRVVVPSFGTSGLDGSFKSSAMVFRNAFIGCGDNCSTGILWSVAEYLSMARPVSTNDFTRLTPNVAEVSWRHRLLEEWNGAVTDGRRQLLKVASEPLKTYIGKLEGTDRRHYVEMFIEKARLSSDERNGMLKLCDEVDESIALYEVGLNLGMGRGCKKDPMEALRAMKASARLGYGPAALVCAMAMETETGWLTTVTSDECGTNVVTAASRLRAYIGTADIGGWYDIHKGRPYVSSLGQNLADDKFVARVRSMYQRAKELGSDLAEDELKRFEATVAWQREIVVRRRQRQEAIERRERERKERMRKSEAMREPLIYDAEPGWTASFAGYVLGRTYPPPESGCVTIYGDTVKMYTPQKTLDEPFHGMDFLQLVLMPTSHRLFMISACKRGFDGDRKSFLDEGRAILKDLGDMMGMELAPFRFEAPDWPYWPNGLWGGPLPELYFADENQWATSRHVFAFSHTKKGPVRVDVRLGIVYDKPKSISMSITDCEGAQASEAEFDKAFRAAHNGQSWTEWSREMASRRLRKRHDNEELVSFTNRVKLVERTVRTVVDTNDCKKVLSRGLDSRTDEHK